MLNVVAIMGRLARDCCLMWQDDCWNKGCALSVKWTLI